MTEHLINRPAAIRACPTCTHPILRATTGGIDVTTDPAPVSITEEITQLLSGHRSYDVLTWGLPQRIFLEWRDPDRIRTRKYPVVTTHGCRVTPPAAGETELVIRTPVHYPEIPLF